MALEGVDDDGGHKRKGRENPCHLGAGTLPTAPCTSSGGIAEPSR
jgi:hypothetical protein